MRRFAFTLIAAALAAFPAGAADSPEICKVLRGLGDEARRTGEPQRISADIGLTTPAACRPETGGAAGLSFCEVAARESGLAWRLYDCVETIVAGPQVATRGEHAEGRNRNAITHLTAALSHGARLDLSESGGRYAIVVWAPK